MAHNADSSNNNNNTNINSSNNNNNSSNASNDTRRDPRSGGSSLQGSSTGPSASPANVGSGHRPALNEWKFPSTPRVATPAPFEPPPQQQDSHPTGASSPAISQMAQFQQQQQPLDYFNQPTSSYALSAQQQLQQQHLQQQQQQQQHQAQHQQNSQPFSINLGGGGGGQFRDGAHTPRSPYSLIGSKDNIHGEPPSQDALLQLQNGLLQAQSLQRSSHSYSQSQDSTGTATELSGIGMMHHMPAYHYQLQHDVAQPGHSFPPPPPPPPHDLQLPQQQQQQGMSLMPHQLQTPSEFALKMLFTQFVKMAEAKLNAMVQIPLVRSFLMNSRLFMYTQHPQTPRNTDWKQICNALCSRRLTCALILTHSIFYFCTFARYLCLYSKTQNPISCRHSSKVWIQSLTNYWHL
jgi:hypothetical protein